MPYAPHFQSPQTSRCISRRATKGYATVNGIRGVIFLPDNWSEAPNNITFQPEYTKVNNTYTKSEWNKMEALGAVFLPALDFGSTHCRYWMSTTSEEDNAGTLISISETLYVDQFPRYVWNSVRLVRDL